MLSEIKALFGAKTAMTITLGGLASSTSGLGRQTTIVDNTTARYQLVHIYYSIKLGTSPTSNKGIYFHLISDDGVTTIRSDSAGASDASLQVVNAPQVEAATTGASAATGSVIAGHFLVRNPGPKWGLAVYHDSGVALDATNSNHVIEYIGENPQSQ
jgi:hypothetical protein